MKSFADLELIEPLQRAVRAKNYVHPTPIQARSIPALLEGRDMLGCAQTGTGKTAAFALPVLQHLSASGPTRGRRPIRALVLSPTRELASQIGESFGEYGQYLSLKHAVVFGGVNEKPQIRTLERGVDILVACPGRLLDLHGRGFVDLSDVEYFILDEADRMLDMGFIHDIRRIVKAMGKRRQNLLFSATMPDSVATLANGILSNPLRVDIEPETATVDAIDQKVIFVDKSKKAALLCELLVDLNVDSSIVFTRTKRGANRLTEKLEKAGFSAAAIHGNKSQNARRRALTSFQNSDVSILVATDVAARGIDVESVTHVFNYDIPNDPESYVHRIGRTGRAGRSGTAIAFCDDSEGEYLEAIEKILGEKIEADEEHPYHRKEVMDAVRSGKSSSSSKRKSSSRGRRNSGRNRNSKKSTAKKSSSNRRTRSSRSRNRNSNRNSNGQKSNSRPSSPGEESSPRRVRRDRRPLSERNLD